MPITITCPDCDSRIRAPDSVSGRPVTCPKCGKHFTALPGSDQPPLNKTVVATAAAPAPPPPAEDGWAEIVQSADEPPPEKPEAKPAPVPEPPPTSLPDGRGSEREEEHSRPPNVLLDFLLFRKMVAPAIVQIFFWFSFVGCILFGGLLFAQVLSLLQQGAGFAPLAGYLFATFAIWFLGPLLARLICEVLILLFRIHDTLREIQEQNARRERE